MILQNEICHIEIKVDETYTIGSADNHHYDVTLNPGHYGHNDFSKTLSIHINLGSREFQIALIGPFYSYDSDCAVLENDILTILALSKIVLVRENRNKKDADEFQKRDSFLIEKTAGN